MFALACEHRTNLDTLDRRIFYTLCYRFRDFLTGRKYYFTCCRIYDIVYRHTTKNALGKSRYDLVAILQCRTNKSAQRSTIFLVDDDVMRNVDKTTCKISGIGRLHGCVGKTLTGTVGRDEVFEYRHTVLEVGKNRILDNRRAFGTGFLRFGHQSAHTRKLTNLVLRTTGTGVEHHEYGVESLIGLGHLFHQHIAEVVVYVGPCVDYLIVTLGIGDESHIVVFRNLTDFLITLFNKCGLLFRNDNVIKVERKSGLVCHAITEVLDSVKEFACFGKTNRLDNIGNDVTQTFL